MRVFINRNGKYAQSKDCHLELCRRTGVSRVIRKGEVEFILSRYTPEPPYDNSELLYFHPECFLAWCLEAVANAKGLDKDSEALLELLPTGERLIQVK